MIEKIENPKLYMILLGCRPPGRNTEQHDMFFCIANSMKDTIPEILNFWPEAKLKIHVDAWRAVLQVDNFDISIIKKSDDYIPQSAIKQKLFFINLGGYKPGEFDEFHYKMLVVAGSKEEAIVAAKNTTFYKHTGFKGATSHIDDKYGIDVDDLYEISEILSTEIKNKYSIVLTEASVIKADKINLGYFKLEKLLDF